MKKQVGRHDVIVVKTVVVKNKSGIHARPASLLVREATRFQSRLILGKNGMEVDLKSILGLMSLAVMSGDTIVIKADGVDECEALEHLADLFESDLGDSVGSNIR